MGGQNCFSADSRSGCTDKKMVERISGPASCPSFTSRRTAAPAAPAEEAGGISERADLSIKPSIEVFAIDHRKLLGWQSLRLQERIMMIGCWAAARAACKHDMAQQMQSRPSHLLPSPAGTAGTAPTARHSAAGTAHLAAIVRRQPRLVLAVQVILHKNGVVVAHAACISGLFQAGQVSQAAAQRSRQHCSHPPEAHRFRDPPLGRMYVFRSRQHSYSMHCSHQPEGPHLWAGCTCCAPAAPAGSRCRRCARARCRGWGSPSRPCWRPESSWAAARGTQRVFVF